MSRGVRSTHLTPRRAGGGPLLAGQRATGCSGAGSETWSQVCVIPQAGIGIRPWHSPGLRCLSPENRSRRTPDAKRPRLPRMAARPSSVRRCGTRGTDMGFPPLVWPFLRHLPGPGQPGPVPLQEPTGGGFRSWPPLLGFGTAGRQLEEARRRWSQHFVQPVGPRFSGSGVLEAAALGLRDWSGKFLCSIDP